jgi:hypothetical protein
MEATQIATFVQKVNEEAALICTKHQLEEAHQLRFVAEAVKMLFTNLKNARNSGEPFNSMNRIINGKLGDSIAVLPLPVTIYALSHVSGTAAMASTMNKLRLSVSLISDGRPQFEQFLSHYQKYIDSHVQLISVKPTEALMQEWLHEQIASSPQLVAARQVDPTMDNPDSLRMLEFLRRQHANMLERYKNKMATRAQQGDHVLQILDRPARRPRSDSSSADDSLAAPPAKRATLPPSAAVHVRPIFGRPQLSKIDTNDTWKYIKICTICDKPDPDGSCEGGLNCLMANNKQFSGIPRLDMRLSNDVKGSGVGKDWFCFTCGLHGHFARDCPQMTKRERDARAYDALAQQALQERARQLANKPAATPKQAAPSNFIDRAREQQGPSSDRPRQEPSGAQGPRGAQELRGGQDTRGGNRGNNGNSGGNNNNGARNNRVNDRNEGNRGGRDDRPKNGSNGTARTRW